MAKFPTSEDDYVLVKVPACLKAGADPKTAPSHVTGHLLPKDGYSVPRAEDFLFLVEQALRARILPVLAGDASPESVPHGLFSAEPYHTADHQALGLVPCGCQVSSVLGTEDAASRAVVPPYSMVCAAVTDRLIGPFRSTASATLDWFADSADSWNGCAWLDPLKFAPGDSYHLLAKRVLEAHQDNGSEVVVVDSEELTWLPESSRLFPCLSDHVSTLVADGLAAPEDPDWHTDPGIASFSDKFWWSGYSADREIVAGYLAALDSYGLASPVAPDVPSGSPSFEDRMSAYASCFWREYGYDALGNQCGLAVAPVLCPFAELALAKDGKPSGDIASFGVGGCPKLVLADDVRLAYSVLARLTTPCFQVSASVMPGVVVAGSYTGTSKFLEDGTSDDVRTYTATSTMTLAGNHGLLSVPGISWPVGVPSTGLPEPGYFPSVFSRYRDFEVLTSTSDDGKTVTHNVTTTDQTSSSSGSSAMVVRISAPVDGGSPATGMFDHSLTVSWTQTYSLESMTDRSGSTTKDAGTVADFPYGTTALPSKFSAAQGFAPLSAVVLFRVAAGRHRGSETPSGWQPNYGSESLAVVARVYPLSADADGGSRFTVPAMTSGEIDAVAAAAGITMPEIDTSIPGYPSPVSGLNVSNYKADEAWLVVEPLAVYFVGRLDTENVSFPWTPEKKSSS